MSNLVLDRARSGIEAATGRLTMYRLVLCCSAGLAAVALAASLVGAIPYSSTALLTSLVAVIIASYASNRAMAAMFAVVPHSESALITGFLLFFIFPPSSHIVPVLGMVLAALLANGSKYILAYRGRHIVNPAAAGAFLLTLTGFYFSGWWVGNPAMLPFAIIVSALILHRTRRVRMALVFIAVSGGVMVARSLAAGIDLQLALLWPLTSSPIIFFAGFMLSEPLTQPPLRRQQLLYAAVIGFLISTPMHIGSIYLAPESALLIGNCLAFLAGQRRGIALILEERSHITPTTVEFAFRPVRKLSFRPGQYLEMTLPHQGPDSRGVRRVFSIASAPDPADRLLIGTKVPERPSTFKRALNQLPVGTVVTATTIAGDFLLPQDTAAPVLLIAGGIGITPFASQLGNLDPGHGRDIVLLYSVASRDEVSYLEVLQGAGIRVVLVSANDLTELPDHWGAVRSSRVDERILREQVPDITSRHVLVSGPPAMVSAIGASARRLRARSVTVDYFSGY